MESLPIVRARLKAAAGVSAKRVGDVHLNTAPEADPLPNVVLMAVGGAEGLTHQGPDGLLSERVRIWARGATPKSAGELGIAIDKALHGYSGGDGGSPETVVYLIEKVSTTSDYDDAATVQRAILDFSVHWRRA